VLECAFDAVLRTDKLVCTFCFGSITIKRAIILLSLTQTRGLEFPVEYSDRLWSSEWWNKVSSTRVGVCI
jgi:hypothetical protein